MITNCASSGADSMANPVTGVVTRKDPLTGAVIPANIRPTSGEVATVAAANHSAEASLSTASLSAILSFQQA
jgi:hypothetical protein